MASKSLIDKARRTLTDEGVFSVVKKTKNYLVFKAKTGFKTDEMRDILFVNGCALAHPERYRVDHQMEQLESNGLSVDKVFYTEINPDKLKFYRAVVVFRCPITDAVRELIEKAHHLNKTVFYDVDDLVIDAKYTDTVDYVQQMSSSERATYDDGVRRMGETMQLCDYCITTTPALARELKKYGKEVFINKNVASERMVKFSLDAMRSAAKAQKDSKFRIGYLSGSITHNPDFELIKPAIIKLMDEYPDVELTLMGHLDLPHDLARFSGRIVQRPFASWESLPEVIASLDVNLAPIEESIFNEAKSENKWTEAALCGVVTVASDFGAFKHVIEDGKTGLLCKTPADWYTQLKRLLEDQSLRERIATAAHQKAMKEYITTYSGLPLARFIESKLAKNIAFVLPSTNISGGVNVVLKHCEILRKNGWDAMVINMDRSDQDITSDDGEVSVISAAKHDFSAKFDQLVATLYTTLKFVKEYPDAKQKSYLVQGFETNFGDYGSPVKREANATYTEQNIRYLTVSRWCQSWLEQDFGQKVRYAPNGIELSRLTPRQRSFRPGDKIKILIEGSSDDYYKNVDEAFKIAAQLDPARYDVIYLSYRSGPKKWYKVDKFYHRVSHAQIGDIYRECDILLKTSILESFSYPPLEMMATGGYVVAIPNEGNQEYLKDGVNCLLYDQGDLSAAVSQITRLSEDATLRKKLDKAMQKTAKQRDWQDLEPQILELYES